MRDIRVATVQFQHAPGDKAYNLGRVRHFVTEAARRGVEIIAFPEMCLTGYWHVRKLSREEVEGLAEPVPNGTCTNELLRLSREHGMTIGAGLIERGDDGRLHNAYVVAMPEHTGNDRNDEEPSVSTFNRSRGIRWRGVSGKARTGSCAVSRPTSGFRRMSGSVET